MNKKVLLIFRVLLYSAAAFIVYDTFFASKTESSQSGVQLRLFKKESSQAYQEYFIKYNEADSSWFALQTMPHLGAEIKLTKESPWKENSAIWDIFNERGLVLAGFYLTPDYALDAFSFKQIVKSIDKLKDHSDERLQKIHAKKELTAIFLKR